MSIRSRIHSLQRTMEQADATGKAYARLAAATMERLRETDEDDDTDDVKIERDILRQEAARYEALAGEMTETSVQAAHEIAFLERRAASVG